MSKASTSLDIATCPGCKKRFGNLETKFRCVLCVGPYCDGCCPERENFQGENRNVRVCHGCLEAYEELEQRQRETLLTLFGKCKIPERLSSTWNMNTPLWQWHGITLTDSGDIFHINVNSFNREDRIDGRMSASVWGRLDELLPKCTRLNFAYNKIGIEGNMLELASNIPHGMIAMFLQGNNFSGSARFGHVPRSLKQLYVNGNLISSIVFARPPAEWLELGIDNTCTVQRPVEQPSPVAASPEDENADPTFE